VLAVLVSMRTATPNLLALLGALVAGACSDAVQPPSHPPMPTARHDRMADLGVLPAPACMTRYDYTEVGVRFDCPTELVDGDPHHYVTTCPAPVVPNPNVPYYWPPPDRVEVWLDDAGRLQRQIEIRAVAPNGMRPYEDVTQVYDAGRLQERTVVDEDGDELWHGVVTARDGGGRPLTRVFTLVPFSHLGKVYPETARIDETNVYDALGRLVGHQMRYSSGHMFWDRTITYRDDVLRLDYMTIIDASYIDGYDKGLGYNPQYKLLDADGRVIEWGCEDECRANDDPPWFTNYVYDEQGRIVREINVGIDEGLIKTSMYDCR
jgi:hypothetical protein